MCTVTYFPTSTGFILTHNRDEAPLRGMPGLFRVRTGADTLLLPRDPQAQGTWIAASKRGTLACLLNGAFVRHERRPPYRRSRGLVLLDLFGFPSADLFWKQYALHDIEPFTLVVLEPGRVLELRWDGRRKYRRELPAEVAHFWCSATLYPPPMAARRERVFRQWLREMTTAHPDQSLLALHRQGSVGDPENDFVMNRHDRVRTLSITQVVFSPEKLRMTYVDLQENTRETRSLRPVVEKSPANP